MIGGLIMNPGIGSLQDTRPENAESNMRAFLRDLALERPSIRLARDAKTDGDGRYGFSLERGIRSCEIEMPGWPIGRVRFLGTGCQSARAFPRLYVDGSSWLWCYALSGVRARLRDHDGAIQEMEEREERVATRELKKRPSCPLCGAFRSLERIEDENEILRWRARCYGCSMLFREEHRDGKKVNVRRMPPEALGGERCITVFRFSGPMNGVNDRCRLPLDHAQPCEGYWQIVGP